MVVIITALSNYIFKTNPEKQQDNKKSSSQLKEEPEFNADVENKADTYDRKNGKVTFKAKYKGEINKGFIAVQIIPPEQKPFLSDTPHLDDNGHVTSFCDKSINNIGLKNEHNIHNIPDSIKALNGFINTEWLEWSWNIPKFSPLGEYKIIIGIWETNKNNNENVLKLSNNGTINISDTSDSNFQPKVRF